LSASSASLPRVVIVGRPNVGKSSLFNRVVGHRQAIVEDEPGTTRDRLEADVEWLDTRFRLVDTGGFETISENVFGPLILEQIRTAMRTATVVVLLVDARDGLTSSDYDIADEVRKCRKPVIFAANKADNDARELQALAESTGLGFGEPLAISALHNVNVGVLLDDVVAMVADFCPGPHRRLGILVDHLVAGTKEHRLANQVAGPHVMVTGHPFVDVWVGVWPRVMGLAEWPEVPRGMPWKEGLCGALGTDLAGFWPRLRNKVRTYADLRPELVGAVEKLIDFVSVENDEG